MLNRWYPHANSASAKAQTARRGLDHKSRRPNRAGQRRRATFEVLESRLALAANMLIDAEGNTFDGVYDGGKSPNPFLYRPHMVTLGNTAYFVASIPKLPGSYQVWKTDGTSGGTLPLVEGAADSYGGYIYGGVIDPLERGAGELTVSGDRLYYRANGDELWTSDGTAAGTHVVDMDGYYPGSNTGYITGIHSLTDAAGNLFYWAHGESIYSSSALWRVDGTTHHAELVVDLGPDAYSPPEMVSVGDTVYFMGPGGLWKSDGSQHGTGLVKSVSGYGLIAFKGQLYFGGSNNESGSGLWTSDGTPDGTHLVKDITGAYLGGAGSPFNNTSLVAGNTLYFMGNDGVHGAELWRSDGTPAGTYMLDINPGAGESYPRNLTNVNGTLFFLGNDGVHGPGEYKTNGTVEGTEFVTNMYVPPSVRTGDYNSGQSAVVGSTLFFTSDNELWKTDGTPGGTVRVKDIVPGSAGSLPLSLTNLNGTLLFSATTPATGRELWKSDGTEAGTVLVKDTNIHSADSNPADFTRSGSWVYFTTNGTDLWRTDGTRLGTSQVKHFAGGKLSNLVDLNGTLIFTNHNEIWQTDGSPAGTSSLGTVSSYDFGYASPMSYNGKVYLPTPVGLAVVDGNSVSLTGMWAFNLTKFNGQLYFTGRPLNTSTPYQLWKTDGTPGGTVLAKNLAPDNVADIKAVSNNALYFFSFGNLGLWKSDGTDAGTVFLKSLNIDSTPRQLLSATDVSGILYVTVATYSASYNSYLNGYEIWRSDGTTAGTTRVSTIVGDEWHGKPDGYLDVGGIVFFTAPYGQLWKTDGTEAGTVKVADSVPPPEQWPATFSGTDEVTKYLERRFESSPTTFDGKMYFAANDGIHGLEPWIFAVDVDYDGIANVVEAAAPNGGDGNYDGIPDTQQVQVASLPNSVDGTYVTVASPDGTVLANVVATSSPSPLDSPAGVDFPIGYLSYQVQQVTPGAATTVTLYLHDDTAVNTFYKYGPTPDNPTPHWYEFLYDNLTGAEISAGSDPDSDPETIVLHFVDGQRGDDDLSANGTIVDPGSPGLRALHVQIDVKPGDANNVLNIGSDGTISVAILTTAAFNAATIDVTSVRFAFASAFASQMKDIDKDGDLDLVLQFRTADTNLRAIYEQLVVSDIDADGVLDSSRQGTSVSLTGKTVDQLFVEGFDAMNLTLSGKALRSLLDELVLEGLI